MTRAGSVSVLAVAAGLLAATAAAEGNPPTAPTTTSGQTTTASPPQAPRAAASVSLSSRRAGAKPVAVTVVLSYPMQCGYPGPGPVVVTFPSQERLPKRIPASAVLVGGHPAGAVSVSGRSVQVNWTSTKPQVMCDVIAEGALKLVFGRAAGLGNPLRVGGYTVRATKGIVAFSAPFTIQAA